VLFQRITLCKSLLERDDKVRRVLGLSTPSLEDFNQMVPRLKPLKVQQYTRFMFSVGLFDHNTQKKTFAAGNKLFDAGKQYLLLEVFLNLLLFYIVYNFCSFF